VAWACMLPEKNTTIIPISNMKRLVVFIL